MFSNLSSRWYFRRRKKYSIDPWIRRGRNEHDHESRFNCMQKILSENSRVKITLHSSFALQESILTNFDFVVFSSFCLEARPFKSTDNIFLCYKHSSLTTKNRKNLCLKNKKIWEDLTPWLKLLNLLGN